MKCQVFSYQIRDLQVRIRKKQALTTNCSLLLSLAGIDLSVQDEQWRLRLLPGCNRQESSTNQRQVRNIVVVNVLTRNSLKRKFCMQKKIAHLHCNSPLTAEMKWNDKERLNIANTILLPDDSPLNIWTVFSLSQHLNDILCDFSGFRAFFKSLFWLRSSSLHWSSLVSLTPYSE